MYEILSELEISEPKQLHQCCGVFIINFEQISDMVLEFTSLTSNK